MRSLETRHATIVSVKVYTGESVAGISELVRSLLVKRGVLSEEHMAAFLEPDYERDTHDPFLLQGMDRALARLLAAIRAGERIAVYADFDCDGIPGAALLSDLFGKIGHDNFEVYLPHRDREGYGFHIEAIRALAARGVSLIITVDVGTNAHEAVSFAKDIGVDVIITDHHEIPPDGRDKLPDAVAVLNPKLPPYPYPSLCGAAVAFKLAQALLAEGRRQGIASFCDVTEGWEKWLLDMVAIATVADMVPLTGENRALTHYGLKVLRKSPRPGINALCAKVRLRKEEITEDDIGFLIAPRINAASRMDEPDLALHLLTTKDAQQAHEIVGKLERLNASRKGLVASVVRQARTHVAARFSDDDRIVVVGNPDWKPALLGLAANSIVAGRRGAVCLWGRDATGALKGSCRADDSVSLTELFSEAGDVFEECGGHERSGGFSVSHERVHTLPEMLRDALARIPVTESDASQKSAAEADVRISLSDVSRELFADISRLSPFGIGNPKPVFHIGGVVVTGVRRFGKQSEHVEVSLECRESGSRCRAFNFFKSPDDFTSTPAQGLAADVIGTIERDSFRGGLALRIADVVSSA
ncbi:MAG: single-stranded-DNA-specific exonuclease RecJ [Patescibacteria group bacterium]|nr:single-stranded-DNA-specific exonuclease RecJ [Patescibacteria group bacterium]